MCVVDSCKSSTQSNFKSDMLICLDSITVIGRVLVLRFKSQCLVIKSILEKVQQHRLEVSFIY
jgi:hypothetical protein